MNSFVINLTLVTEKEEISKQHIFQVNGRGLTPTKNGELNDEHIIFSDDSLYIVIDKILSSIPEIRHYSHEYIYPFYKNVVEKNDENIKDLFEKYMKDSDLVTRTIPFERFKIMMNNLNIDRYPEQESYSMTNFNDILTSIESNEIVENKPLGYEFDFRTTVVDPLKNENDYFKTSKINFNDVFFNHINNECDIFFVLADKFYIENSNEHRVNIYYPGLHKKDIHTIEDLNNEIRLNKETNEEKRSQLIDYFNNIEFQVDTYKKHKESIDSFSKNGITKLEFVYYTKTDVVFPLTSFFKLIHSTKQMPFIKFTPGRKVENIYRLYSKSKTTYGKKIPYMQPNEISKKIRKLKK